MIAGNDGETIYLWDVDTGDLRHTFTEDTDRAVSMAFSPDGQTLATWSFDKTIRLWDVGSGDLLRTLRGHTGRVDSISFSPDGQTLASGSSDGTVLLWNLTTK